MADLLPSDATPTRLTVPVLITLGAAGMLLLGAVGPAPEPAGGLAQVALTAGDSSPALFDARQLVPGHTVSNCLPITGAAGDGREVRLSVSGLTGALVSGLLLRVELGTGDCAAFTGRTVFDGPLTTLAAAGTTGVATGWAPLTTETRTYRLTVEVADDNRFQHTTAGATFTWRDVPRPAPPTDDAEGEPPADEAGSAPPPARTPKDAGRPQPQVPRDSTSAAPEPPDNPARTWAEAPDRTGSTGSGLLSTTAENAWKLLVATAGHPWYLAISLIAMWLFLFIADRRDERDPKLSLAPVLRDPYLTFPGNEDRRAETD